MDNKPFKRKFRPFDHGSVIISNNDRVYLLLDKTRPLLNSLMNTTRMNIAYDCDGLYSISNNPKALKDKKDLGAKNTIETTCKIIVPALIEEIRHQNNITSNANSRLEERLIMLQRTYAFVESHLGKTYGRSK